MITIKLDLPTALDDAHKTRVSKYRWLAKKKKEKKCKNFVDAYSFSSPFPLSFFLYLSFSETGERVRGNANIGGCRDRAQSAENRFIAARARRLDFKSKRSRGRPEQEVTWFLATRQDITLGNSVPWDSRNPGFFVLLQNNVVRALDNFVSLWFVRRYEYDEHNLIRRNMENFSILLGSNTKYSNFIYSYSTKF